MHGIVYLDQLSGARHTHISYHDNLPVQHQSIMVYQKSKIDWIKELSRTSIFYFHIKPNCVFFGMAACNGILLFQGNLPRIFPMSTKLDVNFEVG